MRKKNAVRIVYELAVSFRALCKYARIHGETFFLVEDLFKIIYFV
jgi:hypothetical protein